MPFAQPPLGDLRFSLPQALPTNASGDGNVVVDASNFGPSCPQYESTTPSVYNKWVREYFIWGETGEDCLTVSIWAPSSPIEEKLPVFIWVYGGGESTGGSSVPYQNPQKWVQRTQAHIVVSVQYRLNFFGFPNGPFANGAANLAFADLRLAMEWTRDNIAAFGGDALRMVLWGQSAGAQLVGQMSIGYPDDPIVTGFIQESGSVWDTSSTSYTDTTHQNFTAIAAAFDCTDAANITACLRAVPEADVEAYIQYYADSGKTPALDYQWLVNNVTTFSNYTTPYLTGHYSPLPKIMASMKVSFLVCSLRLSLPHPLTRAITDPMQDGRRLSRNPPRHPTLYHPPNRRCRARQRSLRPVPLGLRVRPTHDAQPHNLPIPIRW